MRPARSLSFLIALAVATGCGAYAVTTRADSAATEVGQPQPGLDALKEQFRRPSLTPFPKSNPHSLEKETLGKSLFFDPRLSRSSSVSCASCHNPSLGWTDGLGRAVGFGMAPLPRRTPPLRNPAWGAAFQWDGRAETLEAQARMPITAPHEMNMTMSLVIERLKAVPGYAPLFHAAFDGDDPITVGNIVSALATYQRTLVSGVAPFDRWISGDETAIGAEAKRGFELFTGKAGCSACHSSWRFTDDSFHDIGLKATDDVGRGKFAPPTVVIMQFAFKTPSLRDLPMDGPYMHDGQLGSLDAVLDHYARGGEKRPSLSAEMKPRELSDGDRRDLIAFINTLRAQPAAVVLPSLP